MCVKCRQQDHCGNDCPKRQQQTVSQSNTEQGVTAKASEVYAKQTASDTYLQIVVQGSTFSVLVDRRLLPRRLAPPGPLKPSDTRLYAANGVDLSNLGTMVLHYHVGRQAMETELVISDDNDETIFGFHWLWANECA
jgi:hypothetical protein